MMRTKSFLIVVAFMLSSVMGFSQQPDTVHEAGHAEAVNDSGCVLSTATNDQTITVHGKVMSEPHDMAFGIPGCNDTVLLTYAGDRDNDVSADQLRKDENLKQFQNYTSAVYKSKGKSLCLQCMKYGDVEATLTGKLQVATMPPGTTKDPSGFLRDSSGKIVGTFGWGHPVPFAKYRLIIQSVSDVKARKLPKPTNTSAAKDKSSATIASHADEKEHFLRYGGRYVRRPPFAERRILGIADGFVRFWYMDKRTHRRETVRCTVKEFIDLWAQHIPQRYRHAVKYFGLFAPRRWAQVAAAVFTILGTQQRPRPKRLPWVVAIQELGGPNPLVDYKGQPMKFSDI